MFFVFLMECQGPFLGLATNTTIKCLNARNPLQENMHIKAVYKMGLRTNGIKSRETTTIPPSMGNVMRGRAHVASITKLPFTKCPAVQNGLNFHQTPFSTLFLCKMHFVCIKAPKLKHTQYHSHMIGFL